MQSALKVDQVAAIRPELPKKDVLRILMHYSALKNLFII